MHWEVRVMNPGNKQKTVAYAGMRGLDGTNSWTGRAPPKIKFGSRNLQPASSLSNENPRTTSVGEIVKREMGHGC